jgi:hypothetical protein
MRLIVAICCLICLSSSGFAQSKGAPGADKTLTNDVYDFINANRILMWFSNNGSISRNPYTDASGLEWPVGSGKHPIFTEGLIIGGLLDGEPHIAGSTYRHGLQAGGILPDGRADNPASPMNRIYRAHRYDPLWLNQLTENERARILADMRDWPVQLGAPWVDANGNGIYDPDPDAWAMGQQSDTPLLPGDEVFWFVSNDMDPSRSSNLYGTIPMGLEFQTMIWASSGHPLLDNVIFREHTIIHKGKSRVTDLRIGAWEDPDLGEAWDDFCGVDTSLGLTIAYNATAHDLIYGTPPASGILWLQTPVTPQAGATARYGLGMRQDYANIPLSGYVHYINGDAVYMDPYLGHPVGAIQMMNYMSGLLHTGEPMIDPITKLPTTFTLAGNAVLGSGWVDGIGAPAGDRRQLSSCGPFTMVAGDTQKVLLARIVSRDGNNLLSTRALRNAARQLRDIFRYLPMGAQAPVFQSSLRHPSADSYEVRVSGGPFPIGTTQVSAVLRSADGAEVQRAALADDGSTGDETAGDGIYGGILVGSGAALGADLFLISNDGSGALEWFVESEIALPGRVRAGFTGVKSDSPNFDGKVNPGDNVRIGLRLENHSSVDMGPWHLFFRDENAALADRSTMRFHSTVPASGAVEPVYDPDDAESYIAFSIPADAVPGSVLTFPVTIITEQYCLWQDTLRLEVEEQELPLAHGLLRHVQGRAHGSLGYSIVDPGALTLHDYRVTIEGADHEFEKTVHVENITLGTTVYRGYALPERYPHSGTPIDGWLLTMGTASHDVIYWSDGFKLWSPTPVFGVFSEPSREWFTIFDRNLLIGEDFTFGSKLNAYDMLPVRLVFDKQQGQKAMCYLRGGSPTYGYQGYFDIPVRAYDISDAANPRQIMLGFSEQRSRPSNDNRWMPTADPNDREILYVFADDYSTEPDEKFQRPINTEAANLDLLYCIWAMRVDTLPQFEDGDTYTVTGYVPVSQRDVYILSKPRTLGVEQLSPQPADLALHPNYPNPFGPGSASGSANTEIRFDLPVEQSIRLAVFDVLGREVAVLAQGMHAAGTYRARFDAASLPNGLYFCRLESASQAISRRMLLLR